MLQREVEIKYVLDDNTWNTDFVEIPVDTPESKINKTAMGIVKKEGLSDSVISYKVIYVQPLEEIECDCGTYYDEIEGKKKCPECGAKVDLWRNYKNK